MKDIFAIVCPITDEIKGISIGRRKFPSSIRRNHQFQIDKQRLLRKGMTFRVELLDVIPSKDHELTYRMYLELFRGWNIPLYNFPNPKDNAFHKIFRSGILLDVRKYMIEDFGYLEIRLLEIYHHSLKRTNTIGYQETLYEVLLICFLITRRRFKWEEIIDINSNFDNLNVPYFDHGSILLIYNKLYQIKALKGEKYLFSSIRSLSVQDLILYINFTFLQHQVKIILNETIWECASTLMKYLHNKPITERSEIEKIILDKSEVLSLKDYQVLAGQVDELLNVR